MSLGDVFWRLYSMGYVTTGCGIIVVFPILATLLLYVASLGSLVGECAICWVTELAPDTAFSGLNNAAFIGLSSMSSNGRRSMHVTKVMSCVATAVGDIAMPDVQSIGLLTAYLIMNNVDFFGARLPSASRRQPTGGLEALLWNFNGFWAMVAFGISASQVHRLSTSFTYTFQCLSMDNMQASDCQSPTSSAADVVLQRSPLCDDVGSLASKRRPTTRAEDTLSVEPTEHAAPADPLQATPVSFPVHARGLNRTYRKRLFRLLFHGCVRIVISVTLLLPVWLQPLEVVDVDLGIVDVLPQSLGDCAANEHLAPQPCAGSGPLAVIRTTTYEATARWLAGLKTTQLNVIRIVLKIEGIIKSLSLSLRVGECLFGEEPGACPVVWDGTDACCDGSVSFIFQMAVECVSSFPYLSRPTLLRTHISKLVVKEKILGIFPIDVADITRTVEDRVSDWARIYLDSQHKWVHWINGCWASKQLNAFPFVLDCGQPFAL
ncbi:hypothetical protein cyc_06732 [Cyclospora cayetanensis]|uniref:Uncharacterized protein n=1 Tax=Cyclospora cayetanensis TaxID=88456 RepID=A0A1D3CYM6_9EIME|nr:hypothetical protein cyc_06732 [Cyclospora cayetanensis]